MYWKVGKGSQVGGGGRSVRSFVLINIIWNRSVAVIRNREVVAKQGYLMYYSNRDAVGTKVSGHYR